VTIAFFDDYLKRSPALLRQLTSLGDVPPVSALVGEP